MVESSALVDSTVPMRFELRMRLLSFEQKRAKQTHQDRPKHHWLETTMSTTILSNFLHINAILNRYSCKLGTPSHPITGCIISIKTSMTSTNDLVYLKLSILATHIRCQPRSVLFHLRLCEPIA